MGLIMPPRQREWRQSLTTYLQSVSGLAFRPGKNDCALFCAGAVKSMTGFDPARGWRGYRTLSEGQGRLAKRGFENWWDMIADRECPPAEVGIGDIALVETQGVLLGGVCVGPQVMVVSVQGLGHMLHSDTVRGFKI